MINCRSRLLAILAFIFVGGLSDTNQSERNVYESEDFAKTSFVFVDLANLNRDGVVMTFLVARDAVTDKELEMFIGISDAIPAYNKTFLVSNKEFDDFVFSIRSCGDKIHNYVPTDKYYALLYEEDRVTEFFLVSRSVDSCKTFQELVNEVIRPKPVSAMGALFSKSVFELWVQTSNCIRICADRCWF